MDMKQIGKRIAALRKRGGLTQEALGERLGLSAQAVSKWETGAGLPEATQLIALAELFRVSMDSILRPERPENHIADFFNRSFAAPERRLLADIPRVSRWHPPEGLDMFYSMPAMLAQALCCIEAYEQGSPEPKSIPARNARFCELMHLTGLGYAFLWEEERHMIEELWRAHDYRDMVSRIMRYYGRDFLWLDKTNAVPQELRRAIVRAIDKGYPVVMEWASGIPEFSIVTGYENSGDTLIGYTACEECAAATNAQGMFVNPARWDEDFDWKVLIVGDRNEPSYTDRDSMRFALDALNNTEPCAENMADLHYSAAGDAALRKWRAACDTPEHTMELFGMTNMYSYALHQNSIYTQRCLQSWFKRLGARHNREINGVTIQIGIAVDRIAAERQALDELKQKKRQKPEQFREAAVKHIDNLLQYREDLRGWLTALEGLL